MRRCQIFSHDSPENADIQKLIVKIAVLFGKSPAKIIKSGSCGKYVVYSLNENGVLTISGNGDMDSYHRKRTPWANEHEMISIVRIQKGVTSVGNLAFNFCHGLNSVTISNDVTSIGYDAFYECTNLTSIIIPDSVTYIGRGAFFNCPLLTSVSVPANAYIADDAFPKTTTVIRRE